MIFFFGSGTGILQASLHCDIIVKEQNLKKAFTLLADGSDLVTVRSLKKVFGVSTGTGTVIGDSTWRKMIRDVKGASDVSYSGGDEIEFEEFRAHMLRVIE